jgi:hypothetical protein
MCIPHGLRDPVFSTLDIAALSISFASSKSSQTVGSRPMGYLRRENLTVECKEKVTIQNESLYIPTSTDRIPTRN